MNRVVLDASAFLAFANNEAGADVVAAAITNSVMSTVNVAEVISVLVRRGVPRARAGALIMRSGIQIESFAFAQAEEAGALITETAELGLSLGDRACLSLGLRSGTEVLTADVAWTNLKLPVRIKSIR